MVLIIWFFASLLAVLLFFRKKITPTILGVILTFSATVGVGWLAIVFLRANTFLASLIGLAVALLFVRFILVPAYKR